VFTELLPSNERRYTYTDTETDERDLLSTPLRWAQFAIPNFIKTGSGIQKLMRGLAWTYHKHAFIFEKYGK
jgi:hypothetical protein